MVIKFRSIATLYKASCATLLACGASGLAVAQSADSNSAAYSALLQEIANAKLALLQQQAYISTQQVEIDSLTSQLSKVEAVSQSVEPMFGKMLSAVEGEIATDLPFKTNERNERLKRVREGLTAEDMSPGEKMSRLYNIYDVEVGYGNSVEAYGGESPINPGNRFEACSADQESEACGLTKKMKEDLEAGRPLRDLRDDLVDGHYLRYGRIALSYLERDESVALRYDPMSKEWVELSASQALELRRGVRTAKGEAAPTVVMAPVYKSN